MNHFHKHLNQIEYIMDHKSYQKISTQIQKKFCVFEIVKACDMILLRKFFVPRTCILKQKLLNRLMTKCLHL